MESILFIDSDENIRDDIRDYISRNEDANQIKDIKVQIVGSLNVAGEVFDREKIDGVIVDAIRPSSNNILPFIRKIRSAAPNVPIIALVGFVDMIVDEKLKQDLKVERVTVMDKLEALANISNLLQSCLNENNGGDS